MMQVMATALNVLAKLEKGLGELIGKGSGGRSTDRESAAVSRIIGRQENPLFVDVGANEGRYTEALLRTWPSAEVHAFEPSPASLARLETRFRNDPRVHLSSKALSDSGGTTTLFADSPGSGLSSLHKRDLRHHSIRFGQANEQVETIRFEDYWSEALARRRVDLLKLDIEGHELAALRGCGHALEAVQLIQFEFGGANIDSRTYLRDFFNLLTGNGFQLSRITPLGLAHIRRYRESEESFVTTNYLARRIRPVAAAPDEQQDASLPEASAR